MAPNPQHSTVIPRRAMCRQQDGLQKEGVGKTPVQDVSVSETISSSVLLFY